MLASSFRFQSPAVLTRVALPLLLTGLTGLTGCGETDDSEQPLSVGGGAAFGTDSGLGSDTGVGFDGSFPPFVFPDASTAQPVDGSRADAGTTDAAASEAGSDASVTPPSADLCHLEGNQVGIMGDSYINLSGDFTRYLQDTARKAGALKANETYLDHSLSGASMDGVPNIPAQWPDVVADAKNRMSKGVKLVIMTGGGNDVLVGNRDCLGFPTTAEITSGTSPAAVTCRKVVQRALDRSQELFDAAVKDGVKAIVFFFYPHLPSGSPFNGEHPNSVLDYAYPEVKRQCEKQTAAPCYFIDTRPAFDNGKGDGLPKDGLISVLDGIHPTPEGSKILSDLVWKVMQDKCFASK